MSEMQTASDVPVAKPGEWADTYAARLLQAAQDRREYLTGTFNGTPMPVSPYDESSQVAYTRWHYERKIERIKRVIDQYLDRAFEDDDDL